MNNQSKKWILIILLFIVNGQLFCQLKTVHIDSLKSSLDTLQKEDLGQRYFQIARQHLEYHPHPDSFIHYINLAGSEAKKYNNSAVSFNYYYYKGVFENRSSNYTSALSLLDSAENISQYTNDSIGLAKVLYAKGTMHHHLGDTDAFQSTLLKVIDISKKINKPTLQSTCLIALSQKAKELELYEQQFELLTEAYGLFDKVSSRTQLKLLTQMGSFYAHQYDRKKDVKDIATATKFVKRGIELADSLGNKSLLTDLWVKLLHLKDVNGQMDQSYLDLSQKVLDYGIKMNDPFYKYMGQLLIGKVYIELQQPNKTLAHKNSLLENVVILNEPVFFKEAYLVLKNAAKASKKYELAVEFNEQFIIYSDSVNSLNKAEAYSDAILKYETEKKEKEILILSKQQQKAEFEATQKEARIKQNLLWLGLGMICILFMFVWNHFRQKNKLTQLQFESSQNEQKLLRSQMNPHFLFNSLNSIKRFYIDGRIEEANDFMADFGNLLRQILEQSSKPFISIDEELEFLTLYLELEKRRFKKELNYTINFDKDQFDFEDQIPSLILQPLVENSIWHGIMKTERDGEIAITVEKTGEDIKCSVKDNGIGYFSTNKSKTHPYTSKGLRLIKERIGKKGKFQIQSISDSNGVVTGTLATLIFKPGY